MYQLKVLDNSRFSKVQQIVGAFSKDIDRGVLKTGERLPTINEFSGLNGVARDTIERAYRRLKASGYIVSYPGRGYFVLDRKKYKVRVLLVFNKLNFFNKRIYDSLQEHLGKRAKIDLCIHHGNPKVLRDILETNLGRYDYYALMTQFHSSARPEEYRQVFEVIPQHEMILLDKHLGVWDQKTNLIYQDFRHDIHEALSNSWALLKKYKTISLISTKSSNYPKELIAGIKDFSAEYGLRFEIIREPGKEALIKHSIYIVEEENDLALIIKKLRNTKLVIGKDVGIISLNESAFNELLDITVFTCDFAAMGRTTAAIILGKEKGACRTSFYIVHRGSL